MKFDVTRIKPGDILAVRSPTSFGRMIRSVLASYSNHNGMFVRNDGGWYIGEAVAPRSKLTHLYEYEYKKDTAIRVLRVPDVSDIARQRVNQFFFDNCLGLKYPLSVVRLWVFRFVNSLPWKIEGEWCTRLVWDAWEDVEPGILNSPQGDRKKNPTPRTIEKRAFAGVLVDVTDEVVI
jgi:hypothetical protein